MPLIDQQDTGVCCKTLILEVEDTRLAEQEEVIYRELKDYAEVPGFRKGKATPTVLRWRFGHLVAEESKHKAMEEALEKAATELELRLVGEPDIHDIEEEKGKPLRFQVDVQFLPKYELLNYEEAVIPLQAMKVTDEDVNRTLENLRREQAPLATVERPAGADDILNVDVEATVDGSAFPGMSGKNVRIVIDDPNTLKEISDALKGKSAEESFEMDWTIPEDFPEEDKRGKTAHISCKVLKVQERKLAELDDAFARDMGHFESLQELKDVIRRNMERQMEAGRQSMIQQAIRRWLLDNHKFPLPPVLLEGGEESAQEDGQEPLDEAQREAAEASRQARNEESVRLMILFQDVMKREDISITDDEFEDFVTARAREMRQDPNRFLILVDTDPSLKDYYRRMVLDQKVMEVLRNKVKIEWTENEPGKGE